MKIEIVKGIIKFITVLMTILFLFCVMCLDSENPIPFYIGGIISILWIYNYARLFHNDYEE